MLTKFNYTAHLFKHISRLSCARNCVCHWSIVRKVTEFKSTIKLVFNLKSILKIFLTFTVFKKRCLIQYSRYFVKLRWKNMYLATLELILQTWLALNSEIYLLCLPSTRIKYVCHHHPARLLLVLLHRLLDTRH